MRSTNAMTSASGSNDSAENATIHGSGRSGRYRRPAASPTAMCPNEATIPPDDSGADSAKEPTPGTPRRPIRYWLKPSSM
jgi:hypothetical protein